MTGEIRPTDVPAPEVPPSFRGAGLSMWTIYRDPADYPEKYVVRHWTATRDGAVADAEPLHIGDSLHDARTAIPPQADACLHRSPDDDPSILETWL